MADGSVPLDDDLGWMLGAVFRAYVRAAEEAVGDLPGGPRGYQVLTAACAEQPRNQGAIAADLGVDRTVLTYLIDELEGRDLVARRPDPADRRSRLITATTAGRAAWEARRQALRAAEAHLLGPLDRAGAASFRRLLQELACGAQRQDPMGDLCAVVAQADGTG